MRATWIAVATLLIGAGACASAPLGVAEFRAGCQVPGRCESRLPCEGEKLTVRGKVDYNNVFDRARYPNLPYEKFWLIDPAGRQVVEVWVEAGDSTAVFAKILGPDAKSARAVRISGVARGFDMPAAGRCSRDVRLELRSATDITIEQ